MGTFYHNKKDNTIIIDPPFKKGDQVKVFFESCPSETTRPMASTVATYNGNTLEWAGEGYDVCAANIKRKRFFSFLEKWEVLEDKFS